MGIIGQCAEIAGIIPPLAVQHLEVITNKQEQYLFKAAKDHWSFVIVFCS